MLVRCLDGVPLIVGTGYGAALNVVRTAWPSGRRPGSAAGRPAAGPAKPGGLP